RDSWHRNQHVHERNVVLATVHVAISRRPLSPWTFDRDLDGVRHVNFEERRDLLQRDAINISHGLRTERASGTYRLVESLVSEHDVEGNSIRASVLAAHNISKFPKRMRGHHRSSKKMGKSSIADRTFIR